MKYVLIMVVVVVLSGCAGTKMVGKLTGTIADNNNRYTIQYETTITK